MQAFWFVIIAVLWAGFLVLEGFDFGVGMLLLGVAFADFLRGVKMDGDHVVTGGFFDLVSPYALLGGVVTLTLFLFHGAVFLALRTEGAVAERAEHVARLLVPFTGVAAVAF